MAANTGERLKECLRAVFPALSDNAIENATTESVAEWDSVQHVTLINLVEEEFAIAIDFDRIEELTSYESFYQYLTERAAD